MADQGKVPISSESDIVLVRKAVRTVAVDLGFGVTDVTRIVTAASELARNIYLYAGSGAMRWRVVAQGGRSYLELVFEDKGPGIPDVDLALEKSYSTSKGLGMGLPGAKRLMDEMELSSEVGVGTRVVVKKWLR